MSKNYNKKNDKSARCSYSGKRTKNKEVILIEYAEEYIRKMGKEIINNPFKPQKNDWIILKHEKHK